MYRRLRRIALTTAAIIALVLGTVTAVSPSVAEPVESTSSTPPSSSTTAPPSTIPSTGTTVVPSSPAASSTTTAPPSTTSSTPSSSSPSSSASKGTGKLAVQSYDWDTGQQVPGVRVQLDFANGSSTTVTTNTLMDAPLGEVTARIVSLPDGYYLLRPDRTTDGAVVVTESEGTSRVAFTIVTRRADRSEIRVKKYDSVTGAPLMNAMFRIWTCGGVWLGDVGTSENGIGKWGGVNGCYRLKEMEAPDGYHLDPTIREVHAPPNAAVEITVYDVPLGHVAVRNPHGRTPIRSIPSGRVN